MADPNKTTPPRHTSRRRRLVRAMAVAQLITMMFLTQLTLTSAWAAPVAPTPPAPGATFAGLTVTPSWEGAPWQPKIQTILDVTAAGAIACCALAFLVGGGAMAIGRLTGSYQAGTRGLNWVLGAAAGVMVIVSTASIVSWLMT